MADIIKPYGLRIQNSSATIERSAIKAINQALETGVAIYQIGDGATSDYLVTVDNSTLEVTNPSRGVVLRNDQHFNTRLGATRLLGSSIAVTGGTVTCYAVYNSDYSNPNGLTGCP